jgi:NAD(P)H dehydrogenase (quinone)
VLLKTKKEWGVCSMATLQKPTVLVLGASGQIGRFVVQQLDQTPEEVQVRVAARTPERCLALQQERREAVLLDLDQPNTFAAALRGVDRVFLLTGWALGLHRPTHRVASAC